MRVERREAAAGMLVPERAVASVVAASSAPAGPPAVDAPASVPAAASASRDVAEVWQRVVAAAGGGPKGAMVGLARLVELTGGTAVLVAAPAQVSTVQFGAKALGDLIQQVIGRPVVVQVRAGEAGGAPVAAGAAAGKVAAPAASPERWAGAAWPSGAPGPAGLREHPLVRTVQDLFPGSRVIDVRGPEGS